MNLNVSVCLEDGRKHLAEVQLNLKSVVAAKEIAHHQYEVIREALPKMCEGTSVGADALEAFITDRLRSSALDAAVTSLERKAGGLMLYARLIAEIGDDPRRSEIELAAKEIKRERYEICAEIEAQEVMRMFPRGTSAAVVKVVEDTFRKIGKSKRMNIERFLLNL